MTRWSRRREDPHMSIARGTTSDGRCCCCCLLPDWRQGRPGCSCQLSPPALACAQPEADPSQSQVSRAAEDERKERPIRMSGQPPSGAVAPDGSTLMITRCTWSVARTPVVQLSLSGVPAL